MGAPSLRDAVQVGISVLNTVVDAVTGTILALTGDNTTVEPTEADNVEWWQTVGLISRPANPAPGQAAAEAITLRRGDRDISIASRDVRGQQLAGNIKPGETCLYASGADGNGQARVLLKQDGSINLYTRKGNSPSGTGMMVQIDAANGAIRLLNDKGYGLIIDSDGVKLTSGDAGLTLTGAGAVTLVGKGKCQIDGSGICLGSTAVPGVNSALTGVTGLVGVASTKVLIATA